jgi:hypothetical protein
MQKIRIMMNVDVGAICVEHLVPASHFFLPLGGNEFTQLAIFVIMGVIWTDSSK